MSNPIARMPRIHASLASAVIVAVAVSLSFPCAARAQNKHDSVVQIEVRDSVGLPLPDAKVEVFTFMEGGVFWEWVPLGTSTLPPGVNLLRFSFPGYRASMFSVPVREGGTLSIRVNLDPERDTSATKHSLEARAVHAIGLALEGRVKTDIVGHRRVLEHAAFEGEAVTRFGPLMRRLRNTELKVLPASGGSFRVFGQSGGGSFTCSVQVMINGDRRRVLPFETFDQLFSVDDAEAIEVFAIGSAIPLSYQVPRSACGLLVVWFRTL